MTYSFADKIFGTVEEMYEYVNELSGELIFCSKCTGYVKKPFAKLSIDGDEFIFCDSDCLENWIREYRKKSEAKILAENDFDFFIINSVAANQF